MRDKDKQERNRKDKNNSKENRLIPLLFSK